MGRLFTAAGYLFGDATSAMQKTIRRGWTDEALYWSHELYSKYRHYVWRRLSVIVIEDVGIGTPETATVYWEHVTRPEEDRSLAQMVRMMCAARKTRLADRFMSLDWERQFRWHQPPTGSYAQLADGMTAALARNDEESALDYALSLDALSEDKRESEANSQLLWSRLAEFARAQKDYPFSAQALPAMRGYYDSYFKWKKKKGWECSMFFAHMILILCRKPELFPLPPMDLSTYRHRPDGREIPDIALDIHTQKGRTMGRTVEDFFEEGMVVEPEAKEYAEDYLDRFKAVCRAYQAAGGKLEKVPVIGAPSAQTLFE